MADSSKMTFEEIEREVLAEIQEAEDYTEKNISPRRIKAWDRYYGRPLGNETKGRSKFMSRDVLEVIEWMLPYFIRQFASGDEDKISLHIEGQSDDIGTALKKKIDKDLNKETPGRFRLFYEWFKDSLVSGTAAVKHRWDLDQTTEQHKFDGRVSAEQMQQLIQDPELEISNYKPVNEGMDLTFEDVEVQISRTLKNIYRAEGVPHWEILISERARDTNDEHGKGQKTRVTLDYLKRIDRSFAEGDEPYFKNLDEIESGRGGHTEGTGQAITGISGLDAERDQYRDQPETVDQDGDETGPRQMVDLIEWYDRLDVDGDGFLEDVVVWFANERMIRWEENQERMIPFSILSPILDCYKFFGTSWAEIIWPLQNLKTMLTRQTLDNFEWTNSGRWRVSPSGNVDIRALMDGAPGEPVRGEDGAIEDISPRPMDINSSMGLLQYVDGMKEERSGVTRIGQGKMDQGQGQVQQGQMPDRGIERLMTAAQTRISLVARVFAETGLRDFYTKAAKLYQMYLDKPFTVRLHGQEMQVQPQQIQGEITTQVNMAVETTVGLQDAGKLQQTLQFMRNLSEQFPALFEPGKVYNLAAQYISSMGWTNIERFLPDKQSFVQEHQKMAQSQQQQQQAQGQMEMQMEERKLKLEELDRQIKLMEAQQKARGEMAGLAQKERESRRKVRQDERSDLRDFMTDLLQLIQDGETEQARQMLERARAAQERIENERNRMERRMERREAAQAGNNQGRAGGQRNPQPSQGGGFSGGGARQGLAGVSATSPGGSQGTVSGPAGVPGGPGQI